MVVATPWDSAVATVRALRVQLANKIVISMVNSMAREARELVPFYPDALERVGALVNEMEGLHAVTAGSMSLASAVEAFTAVRVSINIRHKAHSYVKLAGLSAH